MNMEMMTCIGTIADHVVQIKERQATVEGMNKHVAFLKKDNTNISHGDSNEHANGVAWSPRNRWVHIPGYAFAAEKPWQGQTVLESSWAQLCAAKRMSGKQGHARDL